MSFDPDQSRIDSRRTLQESWRQMARSCKSISLSLHTIGVLTMQEHREFLRRVQEISRTGPQEYEGYKPFDAWQQARQEFYTKLERKGLLIPKAEYARKILEQLVKQQVSSMEISDRHINGIEVFLRDATVQQTLTHIGFLMFVLTVICLILGLVTQQPMVLFFAAGTGFLSFCCNIVLSRPWI